MSTLAFPHRRYIKLSGLLLIGSSCWSHSSRPQVRVFGSISHSDSFMGWVIQYLKKLQRIKLSAFLMSVEISVFLLYKFLMQIVLRKRSTPYYTGFPFVGCVKLRIVILALAMASSCVCLLRKLSLVSKYNQKWGVCSLDQLELTVAVFFYDAFTLSFVADEEWRNKIHYVVERCPYCSVFEDTICVGRPFESGKTSPDQD